MFAGEEDGECSGVDLMEVSITFASRTINGTLKWDDLTACIYLPHHLHYCIEIEITDISFKLYCLVHCTYLIKICTSVTNIQASCQMNQSWIFLHLYLLMTSILHY